MIRGRGIPAAYLSLVVLLWIFGCGGHGTVAPSVTELTRQGWDAFDAGDLEQAGNKFQEAIAQDSGLLDAKEGLGWTRLRQGAYRRAIQQFDEVLGVRLTEAGPWAGNAVAYRNLLPRDPRSALAAADSALARAPSYVFAHDRSMNWKDLRLIRAQCYFALARYADAYTEVRWLGGRPLDANSEFFVQDLLAEIDRVGQEIAAN